MNKSIRNLIIFSVVAMGAGFAGVLFSPGTEGLFHLLLMGLVGLGLYHYRKQQNEEEVS